MKFRQSLFWDINPNSLNPQKHAKYIIERIMDFGNDDEVRWMRCYYPKNLIAKIARKSKILQPSSKNFWTFLTQ